MPHYFSFNPTQPMDGPNPSPSPQRTPPPAYGPVVPAYNPPPTDSNHVLARTGATRTDSEANTNPALADPPSGTPRSQVPTTRRRRRLAEIESAVNLRRLLSDTKQALYAAPPG